MRLCSDVIERLPWSFPLPVCQRRISRAAVKRQAGIECSTQVSVRAAPCLPVPARACPRSGARRCGFSSSTPTARPCVAATGCKRPARGPRPHGRAPRDATVTCRSGHCCCGDGVASFTWLRVSKECVSVVYSGRRGYKGEGLLPPPWPLDSRLIGKKPNCQKEQKGLLCPPKGRSWIRQCPVSLRGKGRVCPARGQCECDYRGEPSAPWAPSLNGQGSGCRRRRKRGVWSGVDLMAVSTSGAEGVVFLL